MKQLTHRLTGAPVHVYLLETEADLPQFYSWLGLPRPALAFDTETTGLDIFTPGFECRLAQFGDEISSWVIPARFREPIRRGLLEAKVLIMHNATFDLLVADTQGFASLEEIAKKTIDTYIYAHILDPRREDQGGNGLGLKPLSAVYVDPDAPDGQKALYEAFKEHGLTIDRGWAEIPLDTEAYWLYAGLDTIITCRLATALIPLIKDQSKLVKFEHDLMRLLARMQRKGLRLDVPYLETLSGQLETTATEAEDAFKQAIHDLGCAPITNRGAKAIMRAVNFALTGNLTKLGGSLGMYDDFTVSNSAALIRGLLATGEELTKKTPKGALCVDKDILNLLCDLDKDGERVGIREPNPLAMLVKTSKRAGKWNTAYVDAMLRLRSEAGRVHPKINGLSARTARMSISDPPFQQLPSSGGSIRNGVIADPGHLIISCDYSQVELRVLAALADEPTMKAAIAEGKDLHDMTATMIYGPEFTKRQRSLAKIVGLGQVYGGGAKTLAAQSGAPYKDVAHAVEQYKENFPGVKAYGRKLEAEVSRNGGYIVTPIGRRLPVDEERTYAATNYCVQSTSRDLFAQALLDLDAAGVGDNMLLPVHDEVLAQAPLTEAEDVAKLIEKTMSRSFLGVDISAEAEVYGPRWGDGYK